MAITAQNARDKLEERLSDLADIDEPTFLTWCDSINKTFYRELSQTDPERVISTQDYTISTNPETEALPVSFRDITANGCGFFKMDTTGYFSEYQLVRTGFGSRDRGYWISGTNVIFTGYDSSTTIKLRYIPTVTTISTMTGATGTFSVPDEYMDYIKELLVVLYSITDEKPNQEAMADQRFLNLRDELLETIRKEPMVYSLTNISSSY